MAASMGTVICIRVEQKANVSCFQMQSSMIHQPMGGTGGGTQQTDMAIAAEHLLKTRKTLEKS